MTACIVPQGAGGTYISGLTNGTYYVFIVRTVDTSGNESSGQSGICKPYLTEYSEGYGYPSTNLYPQITFEKATPNEPLNVNGMTHTSVTLNGYITTDTTDLVKVVYKKSSADNSTKEGYTAGELLADDAGAVTVEATQDESESNKWNFSFTVSISNDDILGDDESDKSFYVYVAALDSAGRQNTESVSSWFSRSSSFSSGELAEVLDISVNAVGLLDAEYSSENSTITLTWTDPEDEDLDHIEVRYSTTSQDDAKKAVGTEVKKGTQTFTIKNVTRGNYYYYRVTAVDSFGNKNTQKNSKFISKGNAN